MIGNIIEYIVTELKNLNFCNAANDKIYGLSKILIIKKDKLEKKIPAIINLRKTTCNASDYIDLIPNTNIRSLVYFEDQGTNLIDSNCRYYYFRSNIRLVYWCNLKLINKNYLSTEPIQAVIIRELKQLNIASFDYISQIRIDIDKPVTKEMQIFGKYDYNEGEKQYLIYPYDYFAIDFFIDWALAESCIDDIEINPDICPK